MICPKCGDYKTLYVRGTNKDGKRTWIPVTIKFCPNCGGKIK